MLYELVYPCDGHALSANADKFTVFIVKIPCALTLHFVLFPEIIKGMNLMKFANNEHCRFVEHGSEIAFFIGFI